MDKKQNISSKDVAREAGVSQATVSYVLNNVKGIKIKPETREAVLYAAKKLNYYPNLIARSMRLKKSMSIGVVSDKNVSNFMFMKVLEGIKDTLVTRNYSITLCLNKSQDIESAEHIKYFGSNRIDGIIFAFATLSDEQISYLVDNNIPFVQIHSNIKSDAIHLVKTDMSNAIAEAIKHFCSKGIKHIAYFGAGMENPNDRRYAGFIKALETNEVPCDEGLVFKYSGKEEELEQELTGYIYGLGGIVPRAILCETADIGFNVLRFAARRGIKVPEELAVAAIGTSKFSTYSYPPLSAIEAPLYDMGLIGAGMLFDIIDSRTVNDVVVLEWEYVLRDSS